MSKDKTKPLGIYVGFWQNDSNEHCKSHSKGLSQEQVDEFKKLKAGDRLILFKSKEDESTTYVLRKFNPPPREDAEGGL